jgi:oligopeptide transport system substrate-binding protein
MRCSVRVQPVACQLTHAGPLELTIAFNNDAVQTRIASLIQADLRRAGVRTVAHGAALPSYQAAAVSGGAQLFRLGWIAPYATADAFVALPFIAGSPSNLVGEDDHDVEALLEAARAEPDPRSRLADYQRAERQILQDGVVIPIAQFVARSVLSQRLRGVRINELGFFDLSTGGWHSPGRAPASSRYAARTPRRSGGIGRRASLRG